MNLLEAQRETAAAEDEIRILEYDASQALDDLSDEMEDPLQRMQDSSITGTNCRTGGDRPSKEKKKKQKPELSRLVIN